MIEDQLHDRLSALAQRANNAPDRLEQVLGRERDRRRRWMAVRAVGAGIAVFAAIVFPLAVSWPGHGAAVATLTAPPVSSLGSSSHPPSGSAAGDCPPTVPSHAVVAVDYVNFVQSNGRNFIAGLQPGIAALAQGNLGTIVLRVRCSFRALNDATGRVTPAPRDGDAAFLAPGTPVFAIRGWSPNCRLAAELDGHLYVYLAYLPGGHVATPDPCALSQRG